MDGHNRTIDVQEKYMSEVNTPAPAAPASEVIVDSPEVVENELDSIGDGLGGGFDESDAGSIDDAQAAGEITKKEAQALKKKLKLKVDGQEQEVEIDFNDEDSLKREFQKARAFDKRSKEHAEFKSQVDQVLQMLQTDPEALLERMGYNVDEMAEKRLSRKIEELKKTPEQIEAEKMRKRLEELEKKEKEANERAQNAELERMKNEQAAKIVSDISEALDNTKSILPRKNPAVMQRIAQMMLFAISKGYANVEAKDVIPLVEKQYKEEYASILAASSDDVLEALASKERLTNYRKAQVKQRAPSVNKPSIQDTGRSSAKKEAPKAEPFNAKNWLKVNPNK